MLQDSQQDHITTTPAAVATFCVCLKIHSGKLTSPETRLILDAFTESSTNYLIQEILTRVTTYSQRSTTAEIPYLTNRRRVHFAMCEVDQQLPWFQQEHSVRTAGPPSMQDMSFQSFLTFHKTENEAATFVGTRHRKLQLEKPIKTNQWSTPLKSTVDHCRVHCIPMEESWPASFALNDKISGRTIMRN